MIPLPVRFNQRVDGFGGSFGQRVGVLAGQRGHGLAETQHQRDRQNCINQNAQEQNQSASQRPLDREKNTKGSSRLKTMMIRMRLSVASRTS